MSFSRQVPDCWKFPRSWISELFHLFTRFVPDERWDCHLSKAVPHRNPFFHVGTSQAGEEWKEVQTVLVNPVQRYPVIVIDSWLALDLHFHSLCVDHFSWGGPPPRTKLTNKSEDRMSNSFLQCEGIRLIILHSIPALFPVTLKIESCGAPAEMPWPQNTAPTTELPGEETVCSFWVLLGNPPPREHNHSP